MTEWILVVFVYAGAFAKGDSVALTTIPGFPTQVECQTAGRFIQPMDEGTSKNIKFVCVKRTDNTKG